MRYSCLQPPYSLVQRATNKRGFVIERYFNDYGWGVLRAMDKVAARYDARLVQVALAWLLTRPGASAPIASATSPTPSRT